MRSIALASTEAAMPSIRRSTSLAALRPPLAVFAVVSGGWRAWAARGGIPGSLGT